MNRREFIRGLIAAPAVVKYGSLMPIRGIIMPTYGVGPMLTATDVQRRLNEAIAEVAYRITYPPIVMIDNMIDTLKTKELVNEDIELFQQLVKARQ